MNIRFYKNFSKRKNSTKQPGVGVAYSDHDCVLKNPTTIENPIITLAGRPETKTASGNPITITDAGAGTAQSLTVDMLPIQAGSGTPSPNNPRPISGRNSLDITVNGNTETVNVGETVYGGTCDVVNGETSSEWGKITLLLSQAYRAEAAGASLTRYIFSTNDLSISIDIDNRRLTLCSISQYINNYSETEHFIINANGQYIYIYLSNDTPVSTEFEICYPLATPTTLTPPATPISLNKGNNTLSTSGDNMSLTYLTHGTQLNYDYAYIDDFKRYYFLRQTTILSNNHIQYELEEDSLASKKTAIGATVARIAFAATGWNKDIVDPRCLVKTTKIKYDASAATELTTTGCYVLTVFNKASGASNGLGATYVLDATNMQKVKEWMGDDTVYQALVNYFGGSPMESIFACIWVPFDYALSPGSAVSKIDIGNQDSTLHGINAYVLSGTGILSGTEVLITIPYRYNDFRDASPYSDAQLYLPGVGNVDINLNDFLDSTKIHILYSMEYGTGDLTYYIKDDGGNLIQTVSCNVASQCPLGQLNINGGGVVSSIGSAAGGVAALTFGAASGNAAMATAGAGALLASASSAVLSYNKRSVSLKGTLGGRTSTEITDIIFTGYYMDTEDVDDANYIATHGRPVGLTHAISNHTGYVQCDNASVVMSGSVLERDRINDYLNTGFFYE